MNVDGDILDAYSATVVAVAERVTPSVASLVVVGRDGRRRGSGSAVVVTHDGFLVTSAHVVGRHPAGVAAFADGAEARFEVLGADPLSDLAVVAHDRHPRRPAGDPRGGQGGRRPVRPGGARRADLNGKSAL